MGMRIYTYYSLDACYRIQLENYLHLLIVYIEKKIRKNRILLEKINAFTYMAKFSYKSVKDYIFSAFIQDVVLDIDVLRTIYCSLSENPSARKPWYKNNEWHFYTLMGLTHPY